MMSGTMIDAEAKSTSATSLTEVIGLIIIYLEPFMMTIDILASIINQSNFIDVFNRLQAIDERLANENVFVSYKFIRKFSIWLILIAFLSEIGLSLMNLVIILDQMALIWKSIGWLMTSIPLFINFVAKTWFLCLILFIRQRLRAINNHLSDLADSFNEKNVKIGKNLFFVQTVEFLKNEIGGGHKNFAKATKFDEKIQVVAPYKALGRGKKQENLNFKKPVNISAFRGSQVADRLDSKLINLCRMHDELCEIAKLVNRMFSFQMLITMAYAFMFITAQCYFMYCGLLGQVSDDREKVYWSGNC